MITYAAINLSRKKFYIGSTKNFKRRVQGHHNSGFNPEFHRALKKNPDNFYWIVGADDGLNDRSEEQFYLDFYHGSMWCYNSSSVAEEPPSQEGTAWWNNGVEQVKTVERPGEGWIRGRLGKWWNNGVENRFGVESPGEEWTQGRIQIPRTAERQGSSGRGNVWWNNGVIATRAKVCPGEGWVRGRLKRSK